MKYRVISVMLAGLISLVFFGVRFGPVSAHQGIQVGDYEVEIGWLNEPPVVGQLNAIMLHVTPLSAGSAAPAAKELPVDISGLKLAVVYGGETRTLELQPLSEESQNEYIASILPTRPGKYTVRLSGTLGAAAASAEVEPEEVLMAENLQFPQAGNPLNAPQENNLPVWLAAAALLVSLLALGFTVFNARKNR
jgi:hypothetical protein